MTATVWLGVDPGVTDTGLVLRAGPDLLAWRVVHRGVDESIAPGRRGIRVGPAYLAAVGAAMDTLTGLGEEHGVVRVACEWVNAPEGHAKRGHVQPRDLVALSIVAGYVVGHATSDVTLVLPARHGQNPLVTYPAELVTPGERRQGLYRKAGEWTQVSHAREAWDVAGAAPATHRQAAALDAFHAARDATRGRRA